MRRLPLTVLRRLPRPWELPALLTGATPPDLRLLSRTLLHALAVGAVSGLVGAGFFATLELIQHVLLENLAGITLYRAHGEKLVSYPPPTHGYIPWLLVLLPTIGGLLTGLLVRFAPDAAGGGGDAAIAAFHHKGGVLHARLGFVKALASLSTLGFGGAGGREGPTMLIGGAFGSFVARHLRLSRRERRILVLAGIAAGIAAVFRTPLGAALLAVEVLYRDGFESDALVPCVLSSVIGYSVVISIYGESTLLMVNDHFPFHASDLPLYILLAIAVSALAATFVRALHGVQHAFAKLHIPAWSKPALGGLALGVIAVGVQIATATRVDNGVSVMTGSYGLAQLAIGGAAWLQTGWTAVWLLALVCGAKLLAAALTIGSGGSAGDFAPSLVLGALGGSVFARIAQIVLHDPTINPAAFALVGMAAFYAGIAHVPLAALVLVCELAHSYDLLVPIMFAEAIALVLLRNHTLYPSQLPSLLHSPAHRDALVLDLLRALRVGDLALEKPVSFLASTSTREMLERLTGQRHHQIFPVVDSGGKVTGVVTATMLYTLAIEREAASLRVAADIAEPAIEVSADDDLRQATKLMATHGVHEIPVVDTQGVLVGMLDEAEVTRVYLDAASRVDAEDSNQA